MQVLTEIFRNGFVVFLRILYCQEPIGHFSSFVDLVQW